MNGVSLGEIFVYTLGISLCHAYFTLFHTLDDKLLQCIWIFSPITVLADIIKLVFK